MTHHRGEGSRAVCGFCGCSEERACRLIEVQISPDLSPYILPPGSLNGLLRSSAAHIVCCQWIVQPGPSASSGQAVCSNPLCVEKAYLEARELAEELTIRLQIRGELSADGIDPARLAQAVDWFVADP